MKKWMFNFNRRGGRAVLMAVLLLFVISFSMGNSQMISDKQADEGIRKLASSEEEGSSDSEGTITDGEEDIEEDATGEETTEENTTGEKTTDADEDTTDADDTEETEKEQYKVSYNKNVPTGASVTGAVVDAQSPYFEGDEVEVLANGVLGDAKNKGFSCNGYSFECWNTEADGSGTPYFPGETFVITEDTTLYAQWQVLITINSFEITPRTIAISQGENYSFSVVVRGTGNLTKEATWEITGQNEEGTTTIDQLGNLHIDREETAGTITVRAISKDMPDRWATATVAVQELVRYDISYNGTGGMGDMTSHNSRYINGTKITIADCAFNRPGYDFVSWNTAVNGNGYTLYPGDEYEMTQDIVMYAQWKRNRDYVESEPEPVEEEPVAEVVKTDKDYAEDTIVLIEAIGEVTVQSLPQIQLARQSYDALTNEQKELIGETELQKLLLKEQLYKEQFGGGSSIVFEIVGNTIVPGTVTTRAQKALAKGAKFNAGGFRYKVTTSSLKAGTVTLVKPLKPSNLKKAVIPAKVTCDGVTYKVTGVSGNAFKDCKKLTKLTVGSNVTTLGKTLFSKNNKCKTVVIKSGKLTKISQNAFQELPKKAAITMPDKKYRAYEKLLKKSNIRSDIRLKTY